MFIMTAKLRRGPILACSLAVVSLVTGIVVVTNRTHIELTSSSHALPSPTNISTTDDQVSYLSQYGWQLSDTAPQVEEFLIPETFDDTYQQYLDLQLSQGFDLSAYSGKRVKRYTYQVMNHPSGEPNVQAGLLIYKNEVISGEILSSSLGGFIHTLSMPT